MFMFMLARLGEGVEAKYRASPKKRCNNVLDARAV